MSQTPNSQLFSKFTKDYVEITLKELIEDNSIPNDNLCEDCLSSSLAACEWISKTSALSDNLTITALELGSQGTDFSSSRRAFILVFKHISHKKNYDTF